MATIFADRADAGRRLARAVAELQRTHPDLDRPVVLALPRGGVPVAFEVAQALDAPLGLVMVRKIGVPWQPELAAGAVVEGDPPSRFLNTDVVRDSGVSMAEIDAATARELAEIERRRNLYLGSRTPVAVEGADVILVDDGVATGATVRAALRGLRGRGARSLTLAIPVASAEVAIELDEEVDHLVCLSRPADLFAIGVHYTDFSQVPDDDVTALLRRAAAARPAARGGPGT
jgi:putative phosphoribosyl transferase